MSGISHLYRDVFALKPIDQNLFRPTEKWPIFSGEEMTAAPAQDSQDSQLHTDLEEIF